MSYAIVFIMYWPTYIDPRETAVVGEEGESPNDRNDRGLFLVSLLGPFSDLLTS